MPPAPPGKRLQRRRRAGIDRRAGHVYEHRHDSVLALNQCRLGDTPFAESGDHPRVCLVAHTSISLQFSAEVVQDRFIV